MTALYRVSISDESVLSRGTTNVGTVPCGLILRYAGSKFSPLADKDDQGDESIENCTGGQHTKVNWFQGDLIVAISLFFSIAS